MSIHLQMCFVVAATVLTGCGEKKKPAKPAVMVTEVVAARSVPAPPEIKQKISKEYLPSLVSCTTAVVEKDASAAGSYQVTFRVDKSGAASPTKIDGPANQAIRDCIDASVKTWAFDPQLDAKKKPVAASFSLPFSFALKPTVEPVAGVGMMDKINTEYMKDIQACQIAAAKKKEESGGKLTIKFQVKADGTIGTADATGIASPVLTDCVKTKLATWQLPPPTLEGKPTDHTFQITLALTKVKVKIRRIKR